MGLLSLFNQSLMIAIGRIRSGWRLELVLFFGILLAVALMASGVIYSDYLEETTLQRTLEKASPNEANVAFLSIERLNPVKYQAVQKVVGRDMTPGLAPFMVEESQFMETNTFFYSGHPQLELDNDVRPRGKLQYLPGIEKRTRLVDGRWPVEREGVMEVAIDSLGLLLLELGVGDEMRIIRPPQTAPMSARVEIVGEFQRLDPEDEFWYGIEGAFSVQRDDWASVPMFTAWENLFRGTSIESEALYPSVKWFYYLDREGLGSEDVAPLRNTLRRILLVKQAQIPNGSISTSLLKLLDRYSEQVLLARIPLFLLVFMSTGILLFYLALVGTVVVKGRAGELSLLKSRGSTTGQLGLMSLVEGLLLAAPAIALGPFLALLAVQALGGRLFAGGEATAAVASVSATAFVLGAAGGLLAVGVFVLVTTLAAHRGMVEFRYEAARPAQTPWLHRYYLDIAILGAIGVLWWQIQSRGSFLVRPLGEGNLQMDYSLLLGPALGLLAFGLLVLRFFPILVSLMMRLIAPIGAPWVVHGLRRLSRDPVMPGILVVLLMIASALGVAVAVLSSSVERSQRDRAYYEAGADLRIEHNPNLFTTSGADAAAVVRSDPGVVEATAVRREDGSLLTSGRSESISVLAVESSRFADVAWFREDLAGLGLSDLTGVLTPADAGEDGILLPEDTTHLALWTQPGRSDYRALVRAKVEDSEGLIFEMFVGQLDRRDWVRLEGPVAPLPIRGLGRARVTADVKPPFRLHSLSFVFASQATEPSVLYLDRLTAVTPDGEELVTEFGEAEDWQTLEDYSRPGLTGLERSESVTREGRATAVYTASPAGLAIRGIRHGKEQRPLPAVVSESFAELADAEVGDTVNVRLFNVAAPIKLMAVAEYFPTLFPRNEPFVVLELDTMNQFSSLHRSQNISGPDEVWVRLLDPLASPEGLVRSLRESGVTVQEVHSAEEMAAERLGQTLVTSGWEGLFVLMFLSVVMSGVSGVMLFAYMDTRDRQTEFALLRTLGLSQAQLRGVVWFTLMVVMAAGAGLGTLMGRGMSGALLPLLEVAEEGVRVTPPMVLESNWLAIAAPYLTMVVVAAIAAPWLAWLAYKLELQRVLRMGAG